MAWRMARSLELLLAEVNARWPNRSKASDGGIGDAAHQSRKSDHVPNDAGVVCARDFTASGIDANWLAEHLRSLGEVGDPRVKYVIWNRRICSRTDGWKWRPYTGANPHDKHVHLSVGPSAAGYDSTKRWGVYPAPKPDPKPEDQMTPAQEAKLDALAHDVRQLAAALAAHDRNEKARIQEIEDKLDHSHPGTGGK